MNRTLADDLHDRLPEAVDRLLAEHGAEIQAVAQVILRDRDAAADVLEETVIAAWECGANLPDPTILRTWLLREAAHRALRRWRRLERLAAPATVLDSTDDDLGAIPVVQLVILEGLALLAPRERAAIALHYLADLPVAEVARAMGDRPDAVQAHLSEALATLRFSIVDGSGLSSTPVELHRV